MTSKLFPPAGPRIESLEDRVLNSVSWLDPGFAANGVSAGTPGTAGHAIAVHGDRIFVAGTVNTATGSDIAVAAFGPDGSLDSTFGTGGWVTLDLGSAYDAAYAIVVQSDGRIVVAGQTSRADTSFDFAVARFNTDGSIDATFGSGGTTFIDFDGHYDQATSLALLGDGILIGGLAEVDFDMQFALARLNTDGSLDANFGVAGQVTTQFSGCAAGSYAMTTDASGRILLAGYAWDWSTSQSDAAVARYSAGGALDPLFGAGGMTRLDWGRDDERANAVAVDASGRIVLAGFSKSSESGRQSVALARLGIAGVLDESFGSGGVVVDTRESLAGAFAMALLADDRLVVAAQALKEGAGDSMLLAFQPDGAVDATFGDNGIMQADLGGNDQVVSLAAASDQTFIAAGFSLALDDTPSLIVARFGTASNTAPLVGLAAPAAGVRGFAMTFSAMVEDPDVGDTHQVSWDFGDGTVLGFEIVSDPAYVAVNHVFAKTGVYTVTVTVRDAAGDESATRKTVKVVAAGLIDDPANPGSTVLAVGGTAGRDVILFNRARRGGKVEVVVNGRSQGTFAFSGTLIVQGGAGNDVIVLGNGVTNTAMLFGGDGNDILIGGSGNDTLDGGSGNDILIGQKGGDLLRGGAGRDQYPGQQPFDTIEDPDSMPKVKKVRGKTVFA